MDLISPIEDGIIKRLKDKTLQRVLVEPYPESPETYEPTHAIGALLVRYSEADYGDTRDTALVIQDRDMMFEITLAMWSLRGKQGGVYAYMEAVRIALTGFKPTGCTLKLTPVNEGFVNRSVGLKSKNRRLWQYQITFRTRTLNIEVIEEEQEPLLSRIIGIDETLDTTTEVP
jgi:hypothetical protein